MNDYELIHDREHRRYYFEVEGMTPAIEYIAAEGGIIYITHTETPYELAGRGIATELVRAVLEDIERQGFKVVPLCGFAAAYIRRNPEWERILREGINIK